MSGEEEVFDMRHRLKVLRSMIPFYKQYLVPTKIIPDLYPILGGIKSLHKVTDNIYILSLIHI